MAGEAVRIGEAARRTGLSIDTIRYYERRALVPRAPRTRARYRLFQAADLERLRFIRRAQGMGFSLREIQQMTRTQADGSPDCARVKSLLEAKLVQVHERQRQMRQFECELLGMLARCRQQAGQEPCRSLREVAGR